MVERVFDPEDPELMDREGEFTPEWEKDLANLRGLNRHFGARKIIRKYFQSLGLKKGEGLRVLDVCTGSADLPAYLVGLAREAGVKITVDAMDLHPATLEGARAFLGESFPEITLLEADILTAEDPLARYDVVLCSLALHHFTSEDAITVLRRMREWSKGGAMVADLERGLVCTVAVWAVTALIYRDPMTVVDGRKSAAAAFSKFEMLDMAEDAGWNRAGRVRWGSFPIGRQAVFLEIGG